MTDLHSMAMMLRMIPMFQPLSDDELATIQAAIEEKVVEAGQVVINEGDLADALYILLEGEVEIVKNFCKPGATAVDVLLPVSAFGEMALVGNARRSATVITNERSRFLTLEREAFREVLLANAPIAFTFLQDAYKRLRRANELMALR